MIIIKKYHLHPLLIVTVFFSLEAGLEHSTPHLHPNSVKELSAHLPFPIQCLLFLKKRYHAILLKQCTNYKDIEFFSKVQYSFIS